MSTISHVTIHHRTVALKRPFVTAIRTAHEIETILVEVHDSEGRSGWGEAPTSWRTTGESAESVRAAIRGPLWESIAGATVGDPRAGSEAMERAAVHNSSARMALECALYDLAAQECDIPLYRYLGGTNSFVRTDATLSAAVTPVERDDVQAVASDFIADGVRTLKLKVGAGGDDLDTLRRLRDTVGLDIRLRIDANQAWSPQQAVTFISHVEDQGLGVEFVEQPVRRDDIDGMAFVTAHVQTPIMADESIWTRRQFREILKSHAADLINVKLAKTGGLREAHALVTLAHENEVAAIVGCMAESHVGISSAAALASFVDTLAGSTNLCHDLDGGLLVTESPVRGGAYYENDLVHLASIPGTGISALCSP